MAEQAIRVLYSDAERVEAVVDGAPPGPQGRLYVIEPQEPTEVPSEVARFMLAHLGYTGVVEVEVIQTKNDKGRVTGTEYNVDKAVEESRLKLRESDELRFQNWINSSIEDYTKRNKPVPPPSPAIVKIIQRGGFDPKKYGIVPMGWEDPTGSGPLAAENAELKAQLAAMNAKLDNLIKGKKVK